MGRWSKRGCRGISDGLKTRCSSHLGDSQGSQVGDGGVGCQGGVVGGEKQSLKGEWQWEGPVPASQVPRKAAHFQQRSRELWGWTLSFWGQSSLVKARRKL